MPKKTKVSVSSIESSIENLVLTKTPTLPSEAKELIVKIAPWLSLISVVIALPALLTLFGLGRAMMGWSMMAGYQWAWSYNLSLWLSLLNMVLMALSIQGLFARRMSAWRLVYYSVWVSMVENLLSGSLIGLLLGAVISFYILFQVKKLYKD